ncbi:hypothetical protein ACOMHN_034570 [Nucella lapillus]
MESSQNDSPIADSIAYLESQGVATDDEDEDDIHFCKKCKQVFKKLEAYLEHKVKHDKYKVAYNRAPGDRRMVLPTLKKKETPKKPQPGAPVRPPRKRRKRKSPPVDVQLIAERNTYICNTCDRKFSREASLKWHIQYDHNKTEGDSEEEEEDKEGGGTAEEGEDDQDVNFKVKEPPIKRVHLSGDDDRPFKCDVCSLGFKEVAVLKTHMLTHSNLRQYKCTYSDCPYAFKTKGSLVRHMRRHTGERPYACESCGRSFAESGALTRHMRSRKPCTMKSDADLPRYGKKWTYVPNIPAVVTSPQEKDGDSTNNAFVSMVPGEMVVVVTEGENGEQILTEAQVVSNNETVPCLGEGVANDVIVSHRMEEGEVGENEVGDLVAAAGDDQELTSTQCKVCREECLEVEALRAHLRLHLADFPFHCGFCHFTTEDRHDLREHLQSKHLHDLKGIDPSVLLPPSDNSSRKDGPRNIRDNKEAQRAVMQLLMLPLTPAPEQEDLLETINAREVSRCPICNRVVRGSSYLRQHMKSHAGVRPHECPVCRKSFVTKDSLNKHLIVHTDERNYKCGVCSKLFKRIAHVREHLKIHSADRPFACNVCDKSFKTNNALKVHARTHSNCYPYECRVCHRHFREKGSMQRHMRTHTGERPFICVRCGRGFAEHGTLNRHLKAKVQCVRYQSVKGMPREESVELQVLEEGEEEGEEQGDVEHKEGEVPTVLAEFSSVVADTQRYIVSDHLTEGDTQQTTEYVVLHTDLGSEGMQDVQIVTEGDIDPDTILSTITGGGNSFVVVREAGNQLRIIDSSTGLTFATMASDGASSSSQTLAEMQGECQSVGVETVNGSAGVEVVEEGEGGKVVVPGSDVGEGGTITVLTDSSGHIILRQQDGGSVIPQGDDAQDSVIVVSDIADAITLETMPEAAEAVPLRTTEHTEDRVALPVTELGDAVTQTVSVTAGTIALDGTVTQTATVDSIALETATETCSSVMLQATAELTETLTLPMTGESTDNVTLQTTELTDTVTLQATGESTDTLSEQTTGEPTHSVTLETIGKSTDTVPHEAMTETVDCIAAQTETVDSIAAQTPPETCDPTVVSQQTV